MPEKSMLTFDTGGEQVGYETGRAEGRASAQLQEKSNEITISIFSMTTTIIARRRSKNMLVPFRVSIFFFRRWYFL